MEIRDPRSRRQSTSRSLSRSRSRSRVDTDPKQNIEVPDIPKPGELQRTASFNVFQKNRADEVVEEEKTRVDVLLVPAISADVDSTFNIGDGEFESIYAGVPGARVSRYRYSRILILKGHLEFYATDLLSWALDVRRDQDSGYEPRPLHFAAHSTGGLVVKKALLIAARSEYYRSIWTACCGITFFGVPHGGSSVMSDHTLSRGVRESMQLSLAPDIWDSFACMLRPGNEQLVELDQDFGNRARRLQKIWTIVECSETFINIDPRKTQLKSKSLPNIRVFIVDRRSATLNTGNEEIIELNASHMALPSFKTLSRNSQFQLQQYQRQLAQLVEEQHSRQNEASLEQQIRQQTLVDVHLFFEDAMGKGATPGVKVLSVRPSLKEFLQQGPRTSLNKRFASDDQYKWAADAGNSPKNQRTVETSQNPVPIDDVELEEPANDPSIPKIVISDADAPLEADEEQILKLKIARKMRHKPDSRLNALRTVKRLWPESEQKDEHFRWVHIPANHPGWALEVFDAVAIDQTVSNQHERIINEHVWHSRYNLSGAQGRPHSRRMRPTARWLMQHQQDLKTGVEQASPSLILYLPYVHWDTVAGVRKRSDRLQKRKNWKAGEPIPIDISDGPSLEEKLLWQHSHSPGNLQLHQRRSLDQYGYPSLMSTLARDHDQVLYKGTLLRRRQEKEENESSNVVRGLLDEELSAVPTDSTTLVNSGTTSTINHYRGEMNNIKPVETKSEKARLPTMTFDSTFVDGKVLMVDQLWLYITDTDTVVSFFTPKEEVDEENSHPIADLRSSIYNDVNGDPRFATQCHTAVEFMALAVLHAVRLVLSRVADEELQVFQIFEDYISYLKEAQTDSFKRFRQTQKDRAIAQRLGNPQGKRTKEEQDEDELDNIEDLRNLTELRDVDDELSILRRLFDEQFDIVKALHVQLTAEKLTVAKTSMARDTLSTALEHITAYKKQVDRLKAQCEAAHEAYKFLLDMRDKQTNVYEVRQARHSAQVAENQNRSIIVFTIATIVFLPLSFFTSFFGMNVAQWSGNNANPSLHTALVLLFAVSIAVIAVSLLLAFNRPVRRIVGKLVLAPLRNRHQKKAQEKAQSVPRLPPRHKQYDLEAGLAAVQWLSLLPQGAAVPNGNPKSARRPSFWEKKTNTD